MASCAALGRNTLVFVSKGTAFCASCRKPSKATNRNVLSFLTGKLRDPPNCWRLKVSLIGEPRVSGLPGLKDFAGGNALLYQNRDFASTASFGRKPYRLACTLLV